MVERVVGRSREGGGARFRWWVVSPRDARTLMREVFGEAGALTLRAGGLEPGHFVESPPATRDGRAGRWWLENRSGQLELSFRYTR